MEALTLNETNALAVGKEMLVCGTSRCGSPAISHPRFVASEIFATQRKRIGILPFAPRPSGLSDVQFARIVLPKRKLALAFAADPFQYFSPCWK